MLKKGAYSRYQRRRYSRERALKSFYETGAPDRSCIRHANLVRIPSLSLIAEGGGEKLSVHPILITSLQKKGQFRIEVQKVFDMFKEISAPFVNRILSNIWDLGILSALILEHLKVCTVSEMSDEI